MEKDFTENYSISSAEFSVLITAIMHAEVLIEFGQLTVATKSPFGGEEELMVPVDAINNDYHFHIRISSESWAYLSPCNRIRLLAHEYASLADIEGSLQDHFSNPFSAEFAECKTSESAYDFETIEDLMKLNPNGLMGTSF